MTHHQMVFTSAPKGIGQSSSGYCTVGISEGFPKQIQKRLESISGYSHIYDISHPSYALNPVSYRYFIITIAGQKHRILSRIAPSGADHTGRANVIAHHILLDDANLPLASPAELFLRSDTFITKWNKDPEILPLIRSLNANTAPKKAWQSYNKNINFQDFFQALKNQRCEIIGTVQDPMLNLIADGLSSLSIEEQWLKTFTTWTPEIPMDANCQIRCFYKDAKRAKPSGRGVLIDLGNIDSVAISKIIASDPVAKPIPKHQSALKNDIPISNDLWAKDWTSTAPEISRERPSKPAPDRISSPGIEKILNEHNAVNPRRELLLPLSLMGLGLALIIVLFLLAKGSSPEVELVENSPRESLIPVIELQGAAVRTETAQPKTQEAALQEQGTEADAAPDEQGTEAEASPDEQGAEADAALEEEEEGEAEPNEDPGAENGQPARDSNGNQKVGPTSPAEGATMRQGEDPFLQEPEQITDLVGRNINQKQINPPEIPPDPFEINEPEQTFVLRELGENPKIHFYAYNQQWELEPDFEEHELIPPNPGVLPRDQWEIRITGLDESEYRIRVIVESGDDVTVYLDYEKNTADEKKVLRIPDNVYRHRLRADINGRPMEIKDRDNDKLEFIKISIRDSAGGSSHEEMFEIKLSEEKPGEDQKYISETKLIQHHNAMLAEIKKSYSEIDKKRADLTDDDFSKATLLLARLSEIKIPILTLTYLDPHGSIWHHKDTITLISGKDMEEWEKQIDRKKSALLKNVQRLIDQRNGGE